MEYLTCKVDNQGRVTLPVDWRKAHSIEAGSEVSVLLAEDRLEIQTTHQSVDEACQMVAKYRKGKSPMELLREERQQQDKREQHLEESHG